MIYIFLIGLILVYLLLKILAVAYHAKSMDAKPNDILDNNAIEKSWKCFNIYDRLNTIAAILVLIVSLIGFCKELADSETGLNLALIIVYILIFVTTVSSFFDAMEYRIERAR